MLWILVALAIAVVASLFFHRFDPSRAWSLRRAQKIASGAGANGDALATGPTPQPSEDRLSARYLTPIQLGRESRFWQLVVSELRLMLKGQRWWWYVVALGLLIASAASPNDRSAAGSADRGVALAGAGVVADGRARVALLHPVAHLLFRADVAPPVACGLGRRVHRGRASPAVVMRCAWWQTRIGPYCSRGSRAHCLSPAFALALGVWSRNLETLRGDLHRVVVLGAVKPRARIRLHRGRSCHELAGRLTSFLAPYWCRQRISDAEFEWHTLSRRAQLARTA